MSSRSLNPSSGASLRNASVAALVAGAICWLQPSPAAALTWKGHTWNVTNGGMAGVCKGDPKNVSIDADGYLHLRISNMNGTWTAAELFTADKLGVGTYQWQVDGAIDKFAPWIVLGMYPYGPAANIGNDGTNEIDIEYSVWGRAGGPNGDWTDYPASGKTIGELAYSFTLSGSTFSTSRFIWSKTSIESFLMTGFTPVGSTSGLLKSWTYMPTNPTVNIPQQALPLGMNLWCFQAPPADSKDIEIVIRDFEMVPEGTSPPATDGGAGTNGGAGTKGAAGTNGAAGETGHAGASGDAGAPSDAGATGAAGTTASTGAAGTTASTGAAGTTSAGGAGAAGASATSGSSGCAYAVSGDDAFGTPRGLPFATALLMLAGARRRRRR
jgi:MYXO-CTERM domain-containing protein